MPGGDHHYTLSWDEVETLRAAGWRYEGVGWYSAPSDSGVPLWRQYNPYARTGTHNYTTSREENDSLVDAGWEAEGVAWYGVDATGSGDGTENPDAPSVTIHAVTFVTGEGATMIPVASVEDGSACVEPAPPTKGNDVFEGWYTDTSCTVPFDFSTPITHDLTLYAKWTAMVSITFRYNVDGIENKVVTLAVGQTLDEPEAPVRPGYRFTGWFYRNGTWDTLFDFSDPIVERWDGLVLDALWQEASDLELTPGWGGDAEPGDYVTLRANNPVSSASSSDRRVARVSYEEGARSVNLHCLEPGVATINVIDDLGQSSSYELHVSKSMYIVSGEGPIKVTSSRYDDALYVPAIGYFSYSTYGIDLYSDSVLGEDGAPDGYEASLCLSEAFDASFEQFYETDDWNNRGYVRLSPDGLVYREGRVYYARIRSFRIEGTTKVYGPWSGVTRIEVGNTRTEREESAKYSYELYFLDAATGDEIYTGYRKNLFIKTDNPDPSSLSLTFEDGTSATGSLYANLEYDDVAYQNPADIDGTFRKVEGGYFVILDFDDPGAYTFQLREADMDGYAVAREFTWEILDGNAARTEWMQGIIDEVTDQDMTSFEKMDAVCAYLTEDGRFSYFTNVGGRLVTLAAVPNNPYFKTYRWDSANSPGALCIFAQLIGGFDTINNMYDDYPYGSSEWMSVHSYVELTAGDETRYYSVCPTTLTGDIGEVAMIDFSDTSALIPAV